MSWLLSNITEEFREEERQHRNRHGDDNGMTAYLLLEQAFCTCDIDPCDCGWDNESEDE